MVSIFGRTEADLSPAARSFLNAVRASSRQSTPSAALPRPDLSTSPGPVGGGGGGAQWLTADEQARQEWEKFGAEEALRQQRDKLGRAALSDRMWRRADDPPYVPNAADLEKETKFQDLVSQRGGTVRADPWRNIRTPPPPSNMAPPPDAPNSSGIPDHVLRHVRSTLAYQMSPEDYAALSPEQQAAVQFNTSLLEASRLDDETGTTDATTQLLARLGIETKNDDELNRYLQLDSLIGDAILAKLSDPAARVDMASSLRYARGSRDSAPDAARLSDAKSVASRAAATLAEQLQATGVHGLQSGTSSDPVPGFGGTLHDQVIQRAYLNMVDANSTLTPQAVSEWIAAKNSELGTTVTPQEVWDFLAANLASVNFSSAHGKDARVPSPEVDSYTGEPFTPLDVAEIRRRYGL